MKAKFLIAKLREEFFTLINLDFHQKVSRYGYWTHHDAGKCFDMAVKNIARKIIRGELKDNHSLEERSLKSFKALVESKECRQFMEDYYGNDK